MGTTNILLLLSLLFTITNTTSSTSIITHHRHLLHQPLFPLTSAIPPTQPPSLSPQPQTLPKYPFSTTPPNTPQRPFFPSFPSPPPPPPPRSSVSSSTTFPANISSLLFPHPQSSHSHQNLIITISISLSLLLAAILAALSAFFIYSRRHHHNHHLHTTSEKTSRTDSLRLFPPNTIHSDSSPKPPKLPHRPGVPNTSSEFLYLGTLVNSRAGVDEVTNSSNAGVMIGVSPSPYQKLGSPDLKPLPPLPKHNYTPSFRSGEVLVGSVKDDEAETDSEEEEFFSPRGSSGRKDAQESPVRVRVESSSRREFQGENFGSRSFNSRTASYPYSNSCSPTNSISTTPTPLSNLSPRSQKSNKSSHTIITFSAPVQSVKQTPPSISLSSPSSSSSSSSPRRCSGDTQNSPEQNLGALGQNNHSPTLIHNVNNPFLPVKLPPPPPPPLPPQRFWEMPVGLGMTGEVNLGSSGPPVLVTPSRSVLDQNHSTPTLANEQPQSNGNVERSEETPKPKLKPLHWDKVRASSDRAMVWDQIKSSSFQ